MLKLRLNKVRVINEKEVCHHRVRIVIKMMVMKESEGKMSDMNGGGEAGAGAGVEVETEANTGKGDGGDLIMHMIADQEGMDDLILITNIDGHSHITIEMKGGVDPKSSNKQSEQSVVYFILSKYLSSLSADYFFSPNFRFPFTQAFTS